MTREEVQYLNKALYDQVRGHKKEPFEHLMSPQEAINKLSNQPWQKLNEMKTYYLLSKNGETVYVTESKERAEAFAAEYGYKVESIQGL